MIATISNMAWGRVFLEPLRVKQSGRIILAEFLEKSMHMFRRTFLAVFSLALLSGCALSSSTISPQISQGQNPAQGIAVRLEHVVDHRKFETDPPTHHLPSLPATDIDNPALTARTIGRKANGFGMPLAPVMLPDGQSVAELVRQATTQAFRQAGYKVISEGDPGYARAIPVDVDIIQYWSWGHQSGLAIAISCNAEASMKASIEPLAKGGDVTGTATVTSLVAIVESDWLELTNKCLSDFIANIQSRLTGTGTAQQGS
jgi:hypothetical protein